jgi:hypothetical protein
VHVHLLRSITIAVVCVLAASCGVQFAASIVDDEFFTGIRVSGKMEAGAPLTVVFMYQTNYPTVVEVVCEVRQDSELLKEIGRITTPAMWGGTPDAAPMPGAFAFDFRVDAPGEYRVECLTPADEDNYVFEEIEVEQSTAPTIPAGNELRAAPR